MHHHTWLLCSFPSLNNDNNNNFDYRLSIVTKQVGLTLGWSSAVFALCLHKEKNTIVKFIDGSSTHNVKPQNKNIKQEWLEL